VRGRTKCPYCGEYVIIEVPDGATGIQTVTCPNCGMKIKVNVEITEKERKEETPIHPTVQKITRSSRLTVAGVMLLIVFLLGIAMGSILLTDEQALYHGVGNYKGKVIDEDGNPVEGAIIILKDENITTTSDKDGLFMFKNVSAGKHAITIEKEGYKTIHAKIFVLPVGVTITSKFEMKKGEGTEKERDITSVIIKLIPVFATAVLIISFLPLIGAILCFMKKYFVIALITSIFGIFSIGFFVGSILSVVALIIILLSKYEFEGEVKY